MSTSSRIAIENKSGTIKASFCHFDGYPEYMGKMLTKHYSNPDKLERLIDLGNLRIVKPNLDPDPTGKHGLRQDAQSEVTEAYTRDGGEDYEAPEVFLSREDYFRDIGYQEYCYLYTKEEEWLVKQIGDTNEILKLNEVINPVVISTEKLIEAGEKIAEEYIKENIGILVPDNFPTEHKHLCQILASALQTKYKYGYEGGSFVRHLVNNNLYESLANADSINRKNILVLASGIKHIALEEIKKRAKTL